MTAAAFAAIADAGRRAILERLSERPHAVHELVAELPVSQSAVSQHLRVLREAGLVVESRAGRFVFYRLRPDGLRGVADWLNRLQASPPGTAQAREVAHRTLAHRAQFHEEEEFLNAELAQWRAAWPGVNPLRNALQAWLRSVVRVIEASSSAVGGRFGLNLADISILGVLHRVGPPHEKTPTNLARISLTSMPGMTRRLDYLEQRGLITRLPSTADRRSRVVRLSEAGSRLIQDCVRAQFETLLEPAFDIPEDEQRVIARSLRRVLLRLQNLRG